MKVRTFFAAMLGSTFVSVESWSATKMIGALKDNAIFQSNVGNSAGGSPGIHVGTNGQGSTRRGLIAFDLAANVPAASTITGTELTMYVGNAPNTTGRTIGLHKLSKDWGEGTAGSSALALNGTGAGFPAGPGDATWSHSMLGSAAWANLGSTGDFNHAASATLAVGGPEDTGHTWLSTAALVSDLQSWLDAPASNYGWALVNANEGMNQSIKTFYSRSATQNISGVANSLNLSWRPTLTIAFVPPPTGDYNGNGVVDAADYVVWRNTLGQSASPAGADADGDRSGTIDDGDLTYWRARFGNIPNGTATSATVPEPAIGSLLFVIGPLVFVWKRR
jgi:hypothetical protein